MSSQSTKPNNADIIPSEDSNSSNPLFGGNFLVPPTDLPSTVAQLQAILRDYIPLLEQLRQGIPTTPAPQSSSNIFSSFRDFIHWNSKDGFTEYVGGGSTTVYSSHLYMQTSAGAPAEEWLAQA